MPKAKKDAKKATIYLGNEVIKKLEDYCSDTGLSKTVAVERFIEKAVNEHNSKKTKVSQNEHD